MNIWKNRIAKTGLTLQVCLVGAMTHLWIFTYLKGGVITIGINEFNEGFFEIILFITIFVLGLWSCLYHLFQPNPSHNQIIDELKSRGIISG